MTEHPVPSDTRPTLSAAVMVYNGMGTIGPCLDALVAFCDEVVVVDDESTDGTFAYLESRGDVVCFQHRHETFAAQRQLVASRCRGAWILTVDADEICGEALGRRIREAIARPGAPDAFLLRHRSPFPAGLHGAYWGWHPRLVRADRCRWVETDNPHSPLDTRGLRVRRLRGAWIEHAPLEGPATLLRKSINRSLILAGQEASRGRSGRLWRMAGSVAGRFFHAFLRHGCWRYGRDGFVMACLVAFDGFAKHAFLVAGGGLEGTDGGPGSYPTEGATGDGPSEVRASEAAR